MTKGRIVAKCEKCDRTEETKVEEDGTFRIRGLLPNNKYAITVVSNEIERSVPTNLIVDVKSQDSKDIKILVISQSPYIEVSGSISFEGEDRNLVFKEDPKAIVEIYDSENVESPIQSYQLGVSRYF